MSERREEEMKENESQSQEEIYHPLVLKHIETRRHRRRGSWTAAKEKHLKIKARQEGRETDGNRDVQVLI